MSKNLRSFLFFLCAMVLLPQHSQAQESRAKPETNHWCPADIWRGIDVEKLPLDIQILSSGKRTQAITRSLPMSVRSLMESQFGFLRSRACPNKESRCRGFCISTAAVRRHRCLGFSIGLSEATPVLLTISAVNGKSALNTPIGD